MAVVVGAGFAKAVSAMRRLVEVEKVPFTLTSYSGPTLAIQPIGAQQKVVMMNGGQSDNLANREHDRDGGLLDTQQRS